MHERRERQEKTVLGRSNVQGAGHEDEDGGGWREGKIRVKSVRARGALEHSCPTPDTAAPRRSLSAQP